MTRNARDPELRRYVRGGRTKVLPEIGRCQVGSTIRPRWLSMARLLERRIGRQAFTRRLSKRWINGRVGGIPRRLLCGRNMTFARDRATASAGRELEPSAGRRLNPPLNREMFALKGRGRSDALR